MNWTPTSMHSLAVKLLGLLLVVLLLLTGIVFLDARGIQRHLQSLRTESEHQSLVHLQGLIELESSSIGTFTNSFSWWDELVTSIEKRDETWMSANLDPALRDYRLDALAVTDPSGHVIHACGIGSDELRGIIDRMVKRPDRTGRFAIKFQVGMADLAFATIHPTADTARATPIRGYLIGIRFWSSERLVGLSKLFGGEVIITNDRIPQAATTATVVISYPLLDVGGDEVGRISAQRTIPILKSIPDDHYRHQVFALILGLAAVMVILFGGIVLVGVPLRRLTRAIITDDADAARKMSTRRDELGAVAQAAVTAIDGRRRIAEENQQRLQAEQQLRLLNDRLQDDLRQREAAETALRESEMSISLALQGGNLCLWRLYLPQQRWEIDHEWLAFLGVSLDPTAGDSSAWEERIDPGDLVTLRSQITATSQGGDVAMECSIRVRRDDGSKLWIMVRGCVAERDDAGIPTKFTGTMLDVTRWRMMEDQLHHSQKMESIGQLAAGIAHEINTPIQFIGDNTHFVADACTTIMGLIDECRDVLKALPDDHPARARFAKAEETADFAYLSQELPKSLEQTHEGIQRVATIVRAMKEFAHPNSAEFVTKDLNHLIRNAAIISKSTWNQCAEMELELQEDLPVVPMAIGDINQMLLNLIVNAAHAIEDARAKGKRKALLGKIHITTHHEDGMAILQIGDDGCGIPAEILDRIWEPFFTTKEVGRGTGQGLTLVHGVVDRHHGTIKCASTPNVGTTFTIRIPLVRSSDQVSQS